MPETISIGFSPCPNDTFIFDAWVHEKIEIPEKYDFQWIIEDVENLNQRILAEEIDAGKLSYHTFAKAQENYQLLQSGSALGYNCGPLLICKDTTILATAMKEWKVAIPGENTTANFLLSLAFPEIIDKTVLHFSEIEDAVSSGEYDAGLIIHESRFTYRDKGLHKILDLGEFWQSQHNAPIPLGGIAVKRALSGETRGIIADLMYRSVQYAFDNPDASKGYIRSLSQEMDPAVCRQHIDLYVNEFTLDLGTQGRKAIDVFLEKRGGGKVVQPTYFQGKARK